LIFDKVYDKYADTMLTYGFFYIQGGKSSDFKSYISNFVIPGFEANGLIIDYSSFEWLDDNKNLNPEVKLTMSKHNCNASNIRLIGHDKTTKYIFNFLNEKGIYEFCSFDTCKKSINIEVTLR